MQRIDNRRPDALRPVSITRQVMKYAEGSCLIEVGNTKVMCSASVEERVPAWLRDKKQGWVTAEYGMLPRACASRVSREASIGKVSGRTQEIQRLIGRCMRGVTDLAALGERTIWLDCDVLQADGGTRTAGITACFVALADALAHLQRTGVIAAVPLRHYVAAVSVGIVEGTALLDLCYAEDSSAQVDMNIVMTSAGEYVELQGTAEKTPFTPSQLQQLLALGHSGIAQLIAAQRNALADIGLKG